MINIFKANLHRLFKNIYFIGGCLIALAVTYGFSSRTLSFGPFRSLNGGQIMFFVSAAMVLFFTVYAPISICSSFSEGFIRNRIISGYTQKEDYLAHVLALEVAVVVMHVFYFVGGVIGVVKSGDPLSTIPVLNIILMLIAVFGYTALIASISYRFKNMIAGVVAGMLIFNFAYSFVMFGNFFLMISAGKPSFKIAAFVYNINVLGQWFANTPYVDNGVNTGAPMQVISSIAVLALSVFIGCIGLEKRDLK
jgi:hypothetical protein